MSATELHPLNDQEFVELEELLASIPETHRAVEADEADGFLVGMLLHPKEFSPDSWMPFILDAEGKPVPEFNPDDMYRLQSLLYRRYLELNSQLKARTPVDPIILEEATEDNPSGELGAFASGFLTSMQLFPGLSAIDDNAVAGAVLGILRHLPPSAQGELSGVIAKANETSPLGSPEDAFEDMTACIAEIAEVTRGFSIKP